MPIHPLFTEAPRQFADDFVGRVRTGTQLNGRPMALGSFRFTTGDPDADVYIRPEPFPSWSLDEHHDWQPPTPMPDDGEQYRWDEDTTTWLEIEPEA